jgi:hypothetical protein
MKKEYIFNQVKYGFSPKYRKWQFIVGNFQVFLSVKGGRETADKIAHFVNAGWIRSKGKGMDNLARANINKVNAE